jgi:hypothetical protein
VRGGDGDGGGALGLERPLAAERVVVRWKRGRDAEPLELVDERREQGRPELFVDER